MGGVAVLTVLTVLTVLLALTGSKPWIGEQH